MIRFIKQKPNPFKFSNFLVLKGNFVDVVKEGWDVNVYGVHQFRLVKKLNFLKPKMTRMLYQSGNLHRKVEETRRDVDQLQTSVDQDPMNEDLHMQFEYLYNNCLIVRSYYY